MIRDDELEVADADFSNLPLRIGALYSADLRGGGGVRRNVRPPHWGDRGYERTCLHGSGLISTRKCSYRPWREANRALYVYRNQHNSRGKRNNGQYSSIHSIHRPQTPSDSAGRAREIPAQVADQSKLLRQRQRQPVQACPADQIEYDLRGTEVRRLQSGAQPARRRGLDQAAGRI